MNSITRELTDIEHRLLDLATHLEGLANDGFGWTKPEAEADRQRFRQALRVNAEQLQKLAARVRVGGDE
jgi:hypothetical protein